MSKCATTLVTKALPETPCDLCLLPHTARVVFAISSSKGDLSLCLIHAVALTRGLSSAVAEILRDWGKSS